MWLGRQGDVLTWLMTSLDSVYSCGSSDGSTTDLQEESSGKELYEVGEEVQPTVLRHSDEDVRHASLSPRVISVHGKHKCKAQRTYILP